MAAITILVSSGTLGCSKDERSEPEHVEPGVTSTGTESGSQESAESEGQSAQQVSGDEKLVGEWVLENVEEPRKKPTTERERIARETAAKAEEMLREVSSYSWVFNGDHTLEIDSEDEHSPLDAVLERDPGEEQPHPWKIVDQEGSTMTILMNKETELTATFENDDRLAIEIEGVEGDKTLHFRRK